MAQKAHDNVSVIEAVSTFMRNCTSARSVRINLQGLNVISEDGRHLIDQDQKFCVEFLGSVIDHNGVQLIDKMLQMAGLDKAQACAMTDQIQRIGEMNALMEHRG